MTPSAECKALCDPLQPSLQSYVLHAAKLLHSCSPRTPWLWKPLCLCSCCLLRLEVLLPPSWLTPSHPLWLSTVTGWPCRSPARCRHRSVLSLLCVQFYKAVILKARSADHWSWWKKQRNRECVFRSLYSNLILLWHPSRQNQQIFSINNVIPQISIQQTKLRANRRKNNRVEIHYQRIEKNNRESIKSKLVLWKISTRLTHV